MTEGSELRAVLVVLLVAALIAGAFVAISAIDVDDDEVVTAAPNTVPTTTSTSAAPLTDDQRLALICDRAQQFEQDIAEFGTEPILVMRVGESFYADVAGIAPADVAAEYDSALDHYTDFNDIGDPLGYDTERILREGDGLRWEQLVTREPFAVNLTRQHISFVCGISLPEPYAEDPEEFAEVKEDVDRELNPERYERPDPTEPADGGVDPTTATAAPAA